MKKLIVLMRFAHEESAEAPAAQANGSGDEASVEIHAAIASVYASKGRFTQALYEYGRALALVGKTETPGSSDDRCSVSPYYMSFFKTTR